MRESADHARSAAPAGPALVASFDLARLDRAFLDDPYPTYRALREHDPVHRMPDGSCFLTRYDDLVAVYHDAKTWSSDKKIDFKPKFGDSLLYEHHTTSLVFNDPPIHTRVRRLLAPTFAPRALKALDMLAERETPNAPAWFVRAICYDKLRRKPEALAAYQKFIELDGGRDADQNFQARQRIRILRHELKK